MADRPFKSMSREKDSDPGRGSLRDFNRLVYCDRCGVFLATGDWPFCAGKAEDHRR